MSDYSRVKKYKELRENIANDTTSVNVIGDTLRQYNEQVKESKETYTPAHEKSFTEERPLAKEAGFKNEYLDSFIQEVREYNMQKGIRENEDTKLDILQQLTSKNREKRANYLEKMQVASTLEKKEEPVVTAPDRSEETMEISRQVFELLNEEKETAQEPVMTEEVQEVEVETAPKVESEPSELEKRIAALEERTQRFAVVDEEIEEEELSQITKRELLEETTKLKVQMQEYKEELNEINSGVDSNNRLLNIVILVLIIALLCVIGVVVYWLIAGGII